MSTQLVVKQSRASNEAWNKRAESLATRTRNAKNINRERLFTTVRPSSRVKVSSVLHHAGDVRQVLDWPKRSTFHDVYARRYPLMIDPQGQAVSWIRSKESSNLPTFGVAALNDPKLRDKLEFTMGDGKALIILGEQFSS